MLNDKVIIYDDNCPMCKLYTYWFVAWGFLKPENRIGFATASAEITSHVDLDRGRHEIPLYDRSTHQTIYGLSAMTFILASRWTWLKPIFNSRPFWWLFHPLYQIITYNRRVIAGCKHCCGFDCAPDLNRFYRSVYLGLASCFVLAVGLGLSLAASLFGTAGLAMMLGLAVVGLTIGTITRIAAGSLAGWNYAGNFLTTLVIVAACLVPGLIWPAMPEPFLWATLVVGLVLGVSEMKRRDL